MREKTDTLDQRSSEMLALLIQTHTATGEPVGSRAISPLSSEGLSSATVRNIIADLEEKGYLEQPHTSAGRVPSDKGYRYYVHQILKQTSLSQFDESAIQRGLLGQSWVSAGHLLAHTSHLLSDLSESVGIVVSPNIARDIIRQIEFVKLSDKRILVITISRAGQVQDRLIRIDEDLSQDDLNSTARYLNANFSGLSLLAMRLELLKRMDEEKALYDRLLQNAMLICERGLCELDEDGAEVFIEGASNIITKRDFADTERIRELLRIFEEKRRLVKILNECVAPVEPPPVAVRIGAENGLPSLRGCAVITSYYGFGDQVVGSLGVVGPARMEYARMIGVVNYVARLLGQTLAEMPGVPAN